jgi:2-amino-4-hydroxy-6-hydroxymethyldihydropteridine diphosphokinase
MVVAFIGVGSNLGDRLKNIQEAVEHLQKTDGVSVVKVSSLIETEPVGGPPQSDYLNGVLKIHTELSPQELLDTFLRIERTMGRKRGVKNGPRIIDLDILLYGDAVINEPHLQIPHPRMCERSFVLTPLLEIDSSLGVLVNQMRDKRNKANV